MPRVSFLCRTQVRETTSGSKRTRGLRNRCCLLCAEQRRWQLNRIASRGWRPGADRFAKRIRTATNQQGRRFERAKRARRARCRIGHQSGHLNDGIETSVRPQLRLNDWQKRIISLSDFIHQVFVPSIWRITQSHHRPWHYKADRQSLAR